MTEKGWTGWYVEGLSISWLVCVHLDIRKRREEGNCNVTVHYFSCGGALSWKIASINNEKINEHSLFSKQTKTASQIKKDLCCEITINVIWLSTDNYGYLGKVWHDGILFPKDERCLAAQVNVVAHWCLCVEGQHMAPGGERQEHEHFENRNT